MKKLAICFTACGMDVIEKINRESKDKGIRPLEPFLCSDAGKERDGFIKVNEPVGDWTETHFQPGNALIFVGALGIAVRSLSGLPKDKLQDCPVIVIDDNGRFVIPVLSGHAGGANKLAMTLSDLLGAVPVITTSTDVNGAFSADTFAIENRLTVKNREGIKKVSVKALEEKMITLSIKDYPPKEKVDMVVADETDAEYSLLLTPKKYTVGLGMKKGKDCEAADRFFTETLKENGISSSDIYAICTIDLKEDEEAVTFLRDKYRIPVLSFDSGILNKVRGDFSASDFVRETVGVDNVCERAAIAGAGAGSRLIQKKKAFDGMTIAIAGRGIWERSM